MPTLNTKTLGDGWSFARIGGAGGHTVVQEGEWLPVKSFPTTVHVELLKCGKIPDPVCLLPPMLG